VSSSRCSVARRQPGRSQRAQQSHRVRWIGVLANEPWPALEGLYEGLSEYGYSEDGNLRIEYRFAEGAAGRLPGLAAELIRLPVDVVVTGVRQLPWLRLRRLVPFRSFTSCGAVQLDKPVLCSRRSARTTKGSGVGPRTRCSGRIGS
jgi:hypothetical protein